MCAFHHCPIHLRRTRTHTHTHTHTHAHTHSHFETNIQKCNEWFTKQSTKRETERQVEERDQHLNDNQIDKWIKPALHSITKPDNEIVFAHSRRRCTLFCLNSSSSFLIVQYIGPLGHHLFKLMCVCAHPNANCVIMF